MLSCTGGVRRLGQALCLRRMFAAPSLSQAGAATARQASSVECCASSARLPNSWCGRGPHNASSELRRSFASTTAWRARARALSTALCHAEVTQPQTAESGATASQVALPPLPEYCTGCGVRLQSKDPERPGCARQGVHVAAQTAAH